MSTTGYFSPGIVQGTVVSSVAIDDGEVAFFGPVFMNAPVVEGATILVGAANADTEAWARKIVIDALKAKGYTTPSLGTMQIVQAVGRMEGYYGKAGNPPAWAGSNNWGAVQCCKAKEGGVCPDNTFASKDYNPDKAETYIACFKKYPTPQAGCEDMIRIMTFSEAEKAALLKADVLAMSTAMYDKGYYQSPIPKSRREEAIAWHAQTMAKNIKTIAEALGEPIGTGKSETPVKGADGKSVAPGVDLSPLLFALLPAGFAVAKALVHMVGDPLIVTPEMARDKIREVDALYSRTDDEYGRAIIKKKVTLAAYKEWTALYSRWHRWSEHKMGTTGDGISPASASVDYEMAKRYDLERFAFAAALEKAGGTPPDRPPEPKPPDLDPDGVLGGGNLLKGAGGALGPIALAIGALAVVAAVRR